MYHIGFRIPISNPLNQRLFVNGSFHSDEAIPLGTRIKAVFKATGNIYEGEVYQCNRAQKTPSEFPHRRD